MSNAMNLFVSHKGEDENRIDDFKKLMAKKGYEFRDSSIRESEPNKAQNDDYIKYNILKPAIDWAGTMVVLLSNRTHESEWVDWEIEYAMKHNKRIIGVFLPGEINAELPEPLKEIGDGCVSWNADKIDKAIKDEIQIWEDADGNSFSPNSPNRTTC